LVKGDAEPQRTHHFFSPFVAMKMQCFVVAVLLALCSVSFALELSPDLERRMILGFVADTFASKGYIHEDPFAPSPLQMVEMDERLKHMAEDTMKGSLHGESKVENKPSEAEDHEDPHSILASLQEEVNQLEQDNHERGQALQQNFQKAQDLTESFALEPKADFVTPEFLETDATSHRTGALKNLAKKAWGGLKAVGGMLLGRGKAKQAAAMVSRKVAIANGDMDKFKGQRVEDCLACRFIWKQVEMDVSNAKYIEDVQASFEHNCLDAQKTVVFYKACEDMYDDMYALTDDYMSSDYTVDKMCQRANMCKL